MIHLTSSTPIMFSTKAVDFRKGIDGLSRLCADTLKKNPRSGTLFVFVSRDATKMRILAYEGNGFWLMTKRLSSGKFNLPKASESIDANSLRRILSGLLNEN